MSDGRQEAMQNMVLVMNFDRLGCIGRQNWVDQTNRNEARCYVEENYKLFVRFGLQQSPTMLVRHIKAWLKLRNRKPPVLPTCIGSVHSECLGHTRSGHWRWPNVEREV